MQVTFLDGVLFVTYFLLLFLSIFWLLVLFSSSGPEKKRKLERYPHFTTIVPAYNEQKSIGKTLQSLANLDYPHDKVQIVVVNDGSKDRTQEIVEEFIASHPERNIILLNQENGGKGSALNNGLKHATGEFFACLDADSFVGSDALQVILPLFDTDEKVAAVCPLIKVQEPNSILQKVQWCEYIINMFYRYLNAKLHCIHVTPGPFSTYRTKIIQDLGGYDEETITEDLEIAIRLQKHNYTLLQTFDTIVTTVAPNSWKTLFRQRVRWYKGGVDNTIKYKELVFNKKYGDFGVMRMPTIFASGVIAIILTAAMFHSLIKAGYQSFIALKAVNFDIFTLIKNYTFTFNFLDLPFFKIAIAGTLLAISFLIMYFSFKVVKEKITNYGRTWMSLFTYLLIYSFFLTTVWFYIAYMFVKRKRNFWS
jgi:cellulose synthase/poly-beta-1,6-N-acetylglucosamine synthase-like glycosyltransferase